MTVPGAALTLSGCVGRHSPLAPGSREAVPGMGSELCFLLLLLLLVLMHVAAAAASAAPLATVVGPAHLGSALKSRSLPEGGFDLRSGLQGFDLCQVN